MILDHLTIEKMRPLGLRPPYCKPIDLSFWRRVQEIKATRNLANDYKIKTIVAPSLILRLDGIDTTMLDSLANPEIEEEHRKVN